MRNNRVVGVIDYGIGNVRSVRNAFEFIGAEVILANRTSDLIDCSHIVLPGVGAFEFVSQRIKQQEIDIVILELLSKQKNMLGICVGHQILFERSFENGVHLGLGHFKGDVVKLIGAASNEEMNLLPNVGRRALELTSDDLLFSEFAGEEFYFLHSFAAQFDSENAVAASNFFGKKFLAAARSENLIGVQFHPEKSGTLGLNFLSKFLEL
jgi:glutamine amidotransferase